MCVNSAVWNCRECLLYSRSENTCLLVRSGRKFANFPTVSRVRGSDE